METGILTALIGLYVLLHAPRWANKFAAQVTG